MIEVMNESSGNVLGIRGSGKLSRADYRDVLAPRVRLLLRQFRKLRVLLLMDEAFEGWSLGAAWANTVFDVKHRRNFEKIAIVGAPKWEEWCAKTAATVLIRGDLQTFDKDQLIPAWEWLRV
ncbi:STAS/SEC14 domain-containing protein [Mycobacterium sp. MFM001]|uniref:STAS/SEC14 domain-containing protein n=1 Tax=Mycobacterium sp. MFM001 TaxID=2049453 RepID=UPI000E2F3435|nr:STAS/SEC14 domain-containing protein [Mycobacterium sp. MFM001]